MLVLWPQISFYDDIPLEPYNPLCNDLSRDMTISIIPILMHFLSPVEDGGYIVLS